MILPPPESVYAQVLSTIFRRVRLTAPCVDQAMLAMAGLDLEPALFTLALVANWGPNRLCSTRGPRWKGLHHWEL
jgi:hypothetical protein